MQVANFSVSPLRCSSRPLWVRSFKKCDWGLMTLMINGFFRAVLVQVLDNFMPLHCVTSCHSKQPTLWFSDHISHLISLKIKAKHEVDKSGDPTDRNVNSKIKNDLKVVIRQAKLDHLQSLVSQSKRVPRCAADVWNYINTMFGHTESCQSFQQDPGSLNSQ